MVTSHAAVAKQSPAHSQFTERGDPPGVNAGKIAPMANIMAARMMRIFSPFIN